jgi:hypothetical protein
MKAIIRNSLVLATLSTALVAAPAGATPPTEASGTVHETALVPISVRTADGNVLITMAIVGTMTGTYTGDFVEEAELIFHADGSVGFRALAICTCTIAGIGSGTLVLLYQGAGTATGASGTYTVVNGTGDLASARGHGTFTAAAGVATYAGRQHYDP